MAKHELPPVSPQSGGVHQSLDVPVRDERIAATRPAPNAVSWGSANAYFRGLCAYFADVDFSELKPLSRSDVAAAYNNLGFNQELQGRVGEIVGGLIPDGPELIACHINMTHGLGSCRVALDMLAAEIAGIRDECYPYNDETKKREPTMGLPYRVTPLVKLLSANFDEQCKAGTTQLAYHVDDKPMAERDPGTARHEYRLLVRLFENAAAGVLAKLGDGFEQERRLFEEGVEKLRRCDERMVVFLTRTDLSNV